jgi:hypothetical protein
LLVPRFVPKSRAERPRDVDPAGQVLVTATLAALIFSVIEGPDLGWTHAVVLGAQVLAVLGVAALIRVETRLCEPLLELRFFGSIPFSGATAIAFGALFSLTGFLFLNTCTCRTTAACPRPRRGCTPCRWRP